MYIVSSSTVLGVVAEENPQIIPVLRRLGLEYRYGDLTVKELCNKYSVNEESLILIINLYLNTDYKPFINIDNTEFEHIKRYFENTFLYYKNVQITNIGTHLKAFLSKSDETGPIKTIEEQFEKFKCAFVEGKSYDPQILADIKRVMIRYLDGRFNSNLYYAVITSLHILIEDMAAHERLRLILIENLVDVKSNKGQGSITKKSPGGLTLRETDVLKLIVRGKLNKEIADELSISFNTVLTHRKNIISKLGIKSVSGLTIYAVINGLVSE